MADVATLLQTLSLRRQFTADVATLLSDLGEHGSNLSPHSRGRLVGLDNVHDSAVVVEHWCCLAWVCVCIYIYIYICIYIYV